MHQLVAAAVGDVVLWKMHYIIPNRKKTFTNKHMKEKHPVSWMYIFLNNVSLAVVPSPSLNSWTAYTMCGRTDDFKICYLGPDEHFSNPSYILLCLHYISSWIFLIFFWTDLTLVIKNSLKDLKSFTLLFMLGLGR